MLITNTRYERVAPNGDKSIVFIKSDDELKYHSDLLTKGFKYSEIKISAPSDSTCLNCEG